MASTGRWCRVGNRQMSGCNLSIIISAPRVDNSQVDISGMQGQADTVVIVSVSSVGQPIPV